MKKELTLPTEIIEQFSKLDVATISDALDKLRITGGLININAVVPDTKLCGQAFTVHYIPSGEEKGTVGDFIDDIQPGEVAVLDNNGRIDGTVWGDIMSIYATQKGIAGTVIDGVCRDVNTIRELNYPIFTKDTYMVTGKDRVHVDYINKPVSISGVQVKPGDLMVGDNSGVLVVPFGRAEEVLKIALDIDAAEEEIIDNIKNGMSLKEAREKAGYHTLQTPSDDE